MTEWSKTWTWFEGEWLEGNPPLMGPRSHAAWLGSSVFDGGRAFEGVTPDIDLHCARVNRSAEVMGLKAVHESEKIEELVIDGLRHFDKDAALYIRPMYWAEEGGAYSVPPLAESTKFCLCIYETPMPDPVGFSITHSSFRRPTIAQAPVNAKAGCLYPNNARTLAEAAAKGFDNALVSDALGNIAELATANVFMAKDGKVHTPVPNGTFLNGVTRQRVIKLLEEKGYDVLERTLSYQDFKDADEIFSTGNYSKVMPVTRIDDRNLQPGPIYQAARDRYWEWAHGG
ncbi:MAG: branched-chain amino acid aminotransferase [Fimbriimonadaceae bacterium]|nr:branched-chain amino acid aminotransferase [Alphaproteobacteria bacterium]